MSWQQLQAIQDEARQNAILDALRPLVDCPVCATRLNVNQDGKLGCPMGDWSEA